MREIRQSTKFKKDLKRELKGRHKKTLQKNLEDLLSLLIVDTPLPARYEDNPLSGLWQDFRDCHVLPDLILIYRKPEGNALELARIGSHSELGL
jgi:mRNA interferase YafQ